MAADSFDLHVVFARSRRLCEKYGIVSDVDCPVPSDDDWVDRMFQAGVDLYRHVKEGARAMRFRFKC